MLAGISSSVLWLSLLACAFWGQECLETETTCTTVTSNIQRECIAVWRSIPSGVPPALRPPTIHSHTRTDPECAQGRGRATEYGRHRLTTRWVSQDEARRTSLNSSSWQQPTRGSQSECSQHSWRWSVSTHEWQKPAINVRRQQALE